LFSIKILAKLKTTTKERIIPELKLRLPEEGLVLSTVFCSLLPWGQGGEHFFTFSAKYIKINIVFLNGNQFNSSNSNLKKSKNNFDQSFELKNSQKNFFIILLWIHWIFWSKFRIKQRWEIKRIKQIYKEYTKICNKKVISGIYRPILNNSLIGE
jgi:hypothetical protein